VLVHPGDEVIVVEPTYDSYVPSIELAGGKPVFVTLEAPEYAIPSTSSPPRSRRKRVCC
jgi:methionine aminotransferase